jgi:hypothetical protein
VNGSFPCSWYLIGLLCSLQFSFTVCGCRNCEGILPSLSSASICPCLPLSFSSLFRLYVLGSLSLLRFVRFFFPQFSPVFFQSLRLAFSCPQFFCFRPLCYSSSTSPPLVLFWFFVQPCCSPVFWVFLWVLLQFSPLVFGPTNPPLVLFFSSDFRLSSFFVLLSVPCVREDGDVNVGPLGFLIAFVSVFLCFSPLCYSSSTPVAGSFSDFSSKSLLMFLFFSSVFSPVLFVFHSFSISSVLPLVFALG